MCWKTTPVKTLATACLITNLTLVPTLAFAEGAVRVLDCSLARLCDEAGLCQPESGMIQFRMSPQLLQEDGSGQFQLDYEGASTSMQALSEIGPFYWTADQLRHTLLASSETAFVWHTLSLQAEPTAKTRFMACTFHL